MSPEKYYQLLLDKAARDEYTADRLIPLEDAPAEIIGFHLQQSAKIVESAFIFSKIEYRRTHNLGELIHLLETYVYSAEDLDEIRELTPYATEWRYDAIPFEDNSNLNQTFYREKFAYYAMGREQNCRENLTDSFGRFCDFISQHTFRAKSLIFTPRATLHPFNNLHSPIPPGIFSPQTTILPQKMKSRISNVIAPTDLVCDILNRHPSAWPVFERHGMCEDCKASPPGFRTSFRRQALRGKNRRVS
jgi:HEPN domain-containing protein